MRCPFLCSGSFMVGAFFAPKTAMNSESGMATMIFCIIKRNAFSIALKSASMPTDSISCLLSIPMAR